MDDLSRFEDRVHQLIALCQTLKLSNQSLHREIEALRTDNAQLVEKLMGTENRVQAILNRIKDIEAQS
ncbi:MAG: hypothetical protein PHI49_03520 [Halothiobacillaceae bacterium]|jgi:uncharacterized protein (TIGR02449 family)|nr:hypothetical protein [Halothiobacillaceae bacterium]MDY0050137.1 hypothetical protein [Halothiobacillaceae bacterium]